jgi:hypothetical protein
MTLPEIFNAMRTLERHGVTQFVVCPELHDRMRAYVDNLDPFDDLDMDKSTPRLDLHFRNKRILTHRHVKQLEAAEALFRAMEPSDPCPTPRT